MKKIGIICEYNQFHNGHLYNIEKIKEMYPDSMIVLVLGSYFLQRGDVSLISKWNKTKIALNYGVNLVIELPTLYGTNSSDYFAHYAIKALSLAEVDAIIFGSETADVELLRHIAKSQQSDEFQTQVKERLRDGSNYPTSLSKSLNVTLKSNDLLGVSYIKSIDEIDNKIIPIPIKRTNEYNDTSLEDEIVSASNIRERLATGKEIEKYIPPYPKSYIVDIDASKMFELVRYRILTESHLERFLGVDEGLENKLKKEILRSTSLGELIENVKSKRYTTSRLKRMLVHILLGIEKEDMSEPKETYKILGFDFIGKKYLKELKSNKLQFKLSDKSEEIEKRAALLYYDLTNDESIKFEFLNKPIIKENL